MRSICCLFFLLAATAIDAAEDPPAYLLRSDDLEQREIEMQHCRSVPLILGWARAQAAAVGRPEGERVEKRLGEFRQVCAEIAAGGKTAAQRQAELRAEREEVLQKLRARGKSTRRTIR